MEDICFTEKCRHMLKSAPEEAENYINLLNPLLPYEQECLLETLTTYYLDTSSEVKKTAQLLFVHRNTVQYRLTKIKSLLRKDISNMPDCIDLYLAVALKRLT